MAGWKFWEKGDQEMGLPSLSSSPGSLDFAQHYEPPAAEPFGNSLPSLPPLGGANNFSQPSFGQPPAANPFQPSAFGQAQQSYGAPQQTLSEEHAGAALHGKDLEIITAKLDAIKAQLETMNMRMTVLEQRMPPAPNDAQNGRRPWY